MFPLITRQRKCSMALQCSAVELHFPRLVQWDIPQLRDVVPIFLFNMYSFLFFGLLTHNIYQASSGFNVLSHLNKRTTHHFYGFLVLGEIRQFGNVLSYSSLWTEIPTTPKSDQHVGGRFGRSIWVHAISELYVRKCVILAGYGLVESGRGAVAWYDDTIGKGGENEQNSHASRYKVQVMASNILR